MLEPFVYASLKKETPIVAMAPALHACGTRGRAPSLQAPWPGSVFIECFAKAARFPCDGAHNNKKNGNSNHNSNRSDKL